jgi:hypothetical protein
MLNWLKSAWDRASGAVSDTIRGWVHDLVTGLYSFLHTIFGDVRGAWKDFVGTCEAIYHALDHFGDETAHAFGLLFRHWIPGIIHWVTTVVWALAKEAWRWITHEGAIIWGYITHPGKLVDLIWDSLWSTVEARAWDLAGDLGKFAVALIWKHLDKFLVLIEDIFDAIF